MKKNILTALFLFSSVTIMFGQEIKEIIGLVESTSNQFLGQVQVTNKSTQEVSYTDKNGNFVLKANENDVLSFDCNDYEPVEMIVGKGNSYHVILKKQHVSQVEGVVITALGISKNQKKIGYATQEISSNNFEKVTTPNIGNLFTGQAAGLNISNPTGMLQSPKFVMRGKTPVIVIDGIIVNQEAFDALNQNNIDNINVLKGTSASALYGSRGMNGAVLITTKGAKKKGVTVNVSQNSMYTAGFTVFPKVQKQYGNGSNGKYEFWDGADGGINDGDMIWGPKFGQGQLIAQWNSPIRNKQTGEVIPWYGNVVGTKYDNRGLYERVPIPWEYHDNLKDFLKPANIINTNFSVDMKGEKGSLRVSGNYINMNDRVPFSKLERGGLALSGEIKITDHLKLNARMSYNKTYSPSIPSYDYNPSGHIYSLLIWAGGDVNGKDLMNHPWVDGMEGYRQANWNYAWYNNPWFMAKYKNKEKITEVLNNQIGLEYKATDHISFKTNASFIVNNDNIKSKTPKSLILYSEPRNGNFGIENNKNLLFDYDLLATYTNSFFKDKVDLTINAGGAINYWEKSEFSSNTDGLTTPDLYNLGNSTGNVKSKNRTEKRLIQSLFSTLDIGFYNALFVNASMRVDSNSTLPKENRTYFYPSLSSSLVVSNIIKMPSYISLIKLYGSWARVSGGLDPYSLKNYYRTDGFNYNGNQSAYYPSALKNKNIKPETSDSYEVGLNTAFFKNRINFNATYYQVKDYNQIIALPVALPTGTETRFVNGNEYTTKGLEISLGFTAIKNDNFSWKSLINWSKYAEKITKIYGNQNRFEDLRLDDRTDSFYDYGWMRNQDGLVILDKDTGMPTRDPYKHNIGHLNPDWTFSFINNFKYKNWTLDIGIDGTIGGIMRSEVVEKMWWGGKHPNSVNYRDEEYATGKKIFIPNGVNITGGSANYDINGNIISDTRTYSAHTTPISWQSWAQNYPYKARVTDQEDSFFANVFDRTFIKLRSVVLTYDFTSHLSKNSFIKGLSVSISGYNLAIWKKSKGLFSDPDFQNTNEKNNSNINDIQDPSSRWIGMGFNVKF